jgi:hypothetical protein
MKLESNPMGESSSGMSHFLSQLTSLSPQVEDMKKDKGTDKEKTSSVSYADQKAMTRNIVPYSMNIWLLELRSL